MTTGDILEKLKQKHPHQVLFLQTAQEILESLNDYLKENNFSDADYGILERMLKPERIISFKVTWVDDEGNKQSNTGYRVQHNSALGPYKGGLRFDPSVSEDVLKFLALEQTLKNALTGLPLGGGKGGSDFNPKGKSDNEIRSFCRAFMTLLHPHIGIDVDVPAGDIGVGAREIGYLFGMYKETTGKSEGAISGKGVNIGGSELRTEATGYGAVYFGKEMLKTKGESLEGKSAVISGAGNVATHVAKKLLEEGAKVLTQSDRSGYLYKEAGLNESDITEIEKEKSAGRSLKEIHIDGATFAEGKPWGIKADMYFPGATQNEIEKGEAETIVKSGAMLVAEVSNMPSTKEAFLVFNNAPILYGPSKAVNAGGVAVSGLEMAQNAGHVFWKREAVDTRLREIMKNIHETCLRYGKRDDGSADYVTGANVGGFVRVFNAMKALGW